MKSGIHRNMESSLIGFQIGAGLPTLSTNEIEGNFISSKYKYENLSFCKSNNPK